MRRAIAIVLALVATVFVTGWVRAVVESRQWLESGEAHLAAGRLDEAVIHFRRSAQWRAPIGSVAADARERLYGIAEAAEGRGEIVPALAAWRAARDAIMATRGLTVDGRDELDRIHRHIAALMAKQIPPGEDPTAAEARFRAQLDGWPERRPSPWLGLLGSVLFAVWIGATALAGWTGLRPDGTIDRARFIRWGVIATAALAGWIVAFRLA